MSIKTDFMYLMSIPQDASGEIMYTIIIPIYNQTPNLPRCFSNLKKLRRSPESLQILLIDDGSADGSGEICRAYAERHPDTEYYYQENRGVSAARNLGLKHAAGRYIFYLDADDCLESDTLNNVAKFFDSVQDEVDLVTYPIKTIYNGRILAPHFRYQYLNHSGVYDLREYPYIGQTTMNIVVRNRFEENMLFDEEQTFSEDQKYCCDVLKEKLKMGFCANGGYLYYRSPVSSSGRLSGACYIFEQCMTFFEELFRQYEKVPAAFQGLYVNDIYWKMLDNILFPYHYSPKEFELAVGRIKSLLLRCENRVILEHPQMDYFEKFYLLRLKSPNALTCFAVKNSFGLRDGEKIALCEHSVELVITKVQIYEGTAVINGFIKSAFLQFYSDMPTLCAVENGGKLVRKLTLYESAHCYYRSRNKTQRFWAFRYQVRVQEVWHTEFEVELGGSWYPVRYYFMPLVPFSKNYRTNRYTNSGANITFQRNAFFFENSNEKDKREEKRIWLYYDCSGVIQDNGYLQFIHDSSKLDGVERYYIVSDQRQAADRTLQKYFVDFGSRKHKKLLMRCEKVITAFIEENNILPFKPSEYEKIAGRLHFETIYLQHGVLHIVMPWKYSPEKILADRVVVSTMQEAKLYLSNGFSEEALIKCRMPRFDKLDRGRLKEKKILYAPSWRTYLVGNNVKNRWQPLDVKFLDSTYYQEIQKFLELAELKELLERTGYTLDIKLHPIFSVYQRHFQYDNINVRFIEGTVEEESYSLMITDFSSFLYDFLYLDTPVITFIPDITEFKSGMNGYRELNYSEQYWDGTARTAEELIGALRSYLIEGKYNRIEADFYKGGCAEEVIWSQISQSEADCEKG